MRQTLNVFLCGGLSLAVMGGAEELDSVRAKRDSKSMSVCVNSDRTADRRSKGVINLLFKSKVRPTGFMPADVQDSELQVGCRLKGFWIMCFLHFLAETEKGILSTGEG